MSVGIIFEEAGLLKKHDRFKLVKKLLKLLDDYVLV